MKVTAADAAQAIKEAKGFVTTAAKRLNVSRTQLYRLINRYPTVKEALDDAREEMKDFAEAQLFKNIRDGKETSLIFYLKTQAKDRGYIERHQMEHSGPDGGPIQTEDVGLTDEERVNRISTLFDKARERRDRQADNGD